jgi:hypothetical protein
MGRRHGVIGNRHGSPLHFLNWSRRSSSCCCCSDQPRQLGDIHRDPSHLAFGEQLGGRSPARLWKATLREINGIAM